MITTALALMNITEAAPSFAKHSSLEIADNAAMEYAEQLNPRYQAFANRVSSGIRKRTKATNIYAHTMNVIMHAPDDDLLRGLTVDRISLRQARVNLAFCSAT